MKELTTNEAEALRAELIHMILFSVAWAIIGEYILNFSDYAIGGGLVLVAAVCLGLYSIKLYKREDDLKTDTGPAVDVRQSKRDRLYLRIFVFEVVAILATWILMLNFGHANWLVSGFALVAGLHFLPLARVVAMKSYYVLGCWISVLAIGGYQLISAGAMPDHFVNVVIAYGCSAGALVDGIWIMVKTRRMLR
ncbi:MAG TPA: hypothetical protein VMH27_21875 [Puia sp.]|nr:hypothetical protein [Puia sp.]